MTGDAATLAFADLQPEDIISTLADLGFQPENRHLHISLVCTRATLEPALDVGIRHRLAEQVHEHAFPSGAFLARLATAHGESPDLTR